MAVYSCNYPVWHTFDTSRHALITYSIYIGSTKIYAGKLYPYDTVSQTLRIDISEICREYLETFYEDITISGVTSGHIPTNGLISSINTFIVESSDNAPTTSSAEVGDDVSYPVVYDYSTDYPGLLADKRYLNDPIDNRVHPKQYLFINGYNVTGTTQLYTYQINNGTVNNINILPVTESSFQSVVIPLFSYTLQEGNTITLKMDGFTAEEYIVTHECNNPETQKHNKQYVLYYVNKYGGMDSILLSGKNTQSWTPSHTNINLYNNRDNRKEWQQKRLNSTIDHKWELNTGLLSNEQAAKIDHLIYSPKVMMHDLAAGTLTTVLIEDTNYTVKQYPYAIPQYTIKVKESQKQLRR